MKKHLSFSLLAITLFLSYGHEYIPSGENHEYSKLENTQDFHHSDDSEDRRLDEVPIFVLRFGPGTAGGGSLIYPLRSRCHNGDIYVPAFMKNQIKVYDEYGVYKWKFATEGGPHGLCFDEDENIYVVHYKKKSVVKYDANGNFLKRVGGFSSPPTTCDIVHNKLFVPRTAAGVMTVFSLDLEDLNQHISESISSICSDSSDNIYVTIDKPVVLIKKFDHQGSLLLTIDSGLGEQNSDCAVTEYGLIHVASVTDKSIRVFDANGEYLYKYSLPYKPNGLTINAAGTDMFVTYNYAEQRHAVEKFQLLAPGTSSPTISPTVSPTSSPTISPTVSPTSSPIVSPTSSPTISPTVSPTEMSSAFLNFTSHSFSLSDNGKPEFVKFHYEKASGRSMTFNIFDSDCVNLVHASVSVCESRSTNVGSGYFAQLCFDESQMHPDLNKMKMCAVLEMLDGDVTLTEARIFNFFWKNSSSAQTSEISSADSSEDTSASNGQVLCLGQPSENFCDCGGDCIQQPEWCSCEEAKKCCEVA